MVIIKKYKCFYFSCSVKKLSLSFDFLWFQTFIFTVWHIKDQNTKSLTNF